MNTAYDVNARPSAQNLVSGSTVYALTQTGYDALGRVECVAQRMNPAIFATITTAACSLGTQGTGSNDFGPDRIVRTSYDAAGRVVQSTSAYGVTGQQADDATATYTANGLVQTVTDAENNKTSYAYDGLDRLSQTFYPSATKGAGTSNASDYEQRGYDANGNVTSFRNRAAETTGFTYDALSRRTFKDLPGSEPDVTYVYDLLGRMTSAATSSQTLSFTWDALGRQLTEAGPQGTMSSSWDVGGRRTRLAWPDGFYVDHDYLVTGETAHIFETDGAGGHATSGVGVLATFAYDDLGRRTSLTRGNGTSTSYSYDGVSRLSSLAQDASGTTYDQTLGFAYSPASQIVSNTRSNDLFAWGGHGSGTTSSTANGLNQITVLGGTSTSHDSRGNMTADGLGKTFGYTSENLLTSASGSVTLTYDPAMRLYQVAGAATTRFQYDGADLIAEYNGSNSLQRRYVHGPGTDEPLVWYEGSGTTDRRFLHADERGSIVAVSNSSGSVTSVNTYDEYGKPGSANAGRFQYTGQKWIVELGLYDYKARMYHPNLGRFVQTDPIGYGGGMNIYAGMRGDPVNLVDSAGTAGCPVGSHSEVPTGTHIAVCVLNDDGDGDGGGGGGGGDEGGGGGGRGKGPLAGGPLNGSPTCPGCITSIGDSRYPDSLSGHGGLYIDQRWVFAGLGSGSGVLSNASHAAPRPGGETDYDRIRAAQRRMVATCGNGMTPAACEKAQSDYQKLWRDISRASPPLPTMTFKEVRPPLWEVITGLSSCVLGVTNPGGWIASSFTSAACASGAKALGNYIIPEERRQ